MYCIKIMAETQTTILLFTHHLSAAIFIFLNDNHFPSFFIKNAQKINIYTAPQDDNEIWIVL